jgi:hypothetical protein
MAASANPLTSKAKAPVSIRDKWRTKTNYRAKRVTGYAPIAFAMVVEVGRLTTGKATQLLYVILTASLGQIVKPDQPFKESASDLRTADLAQLCGCDERTIQRELGDLARRNIIAWDQSKKGWNNVTPLFRSWASLPDYQAAPVAEPDPEPDDEDEPPAEDPAAPSGVRTVITSKPVRCSPGKPSKPVKVECGISSLQFLDDIDSEFSAVVEPGGTLLVSRRSWKHSDGVRGLKQAKDLDAVPRQGCRGNEPKGGRRNSETQQSKANGRRENSRGSVTPAVQHPRADELSALFDPILLEHCHKSLSGDTIALRAACEAIGDTEHKFLVDVVSERAQRRVSSPRAAVAICIEIAGNWQKVKNLPASQQKFKAPLSKSEARDEKALQMLKALNAARRGKRNGAA